ncbi:helix-turn-helix domain-containing protein [Pseudaestuariivita atlantica]|uniref:XRE family transcriptional regulator n=1 Tax=Pseudaestuariivita atlantica TaxID=1317121 RepID=A0A0L1JV44_9RHOB|nr:XRE family transcriptional regulator [Pseudaestuariivita atlantica]KNG95620.1 XRE family transcriptional regulator [Pseudaestuariivita atlantica]
MPPSSEITDRLASRLKEERAARGLSLEALASLSGVSRSMLSQIERGESSPTVASLWHLTQALDLDFSELLDATPSEKSPIIDLHRAGQVPVISRPDAGVTIRILSPPEDVGIAEVYEVIFKSGGALVSEPHSPGCSEALTVLGGGPVAVTSSSDTETLNAGDTMRYRADVPHAITAPEGARTILVVRNS